MDEFLTCDGCGKKIFVGDQTIGLKLDEDLEGILIHKSFECLLKLDGAEEGTVSGIRTIPPEELYPSRPTITRIK